MNRKFEVGRPAIAELVLLVAWIAFAGRASLPAKPASASAAAPPARLSIEANVAVVAVSAAAWEKAGVVVAPLRTATNRLEIQTYGVVINPSNLVEMRQSYVAASARVETAQAELKVTEEEYQRAKLLYHQNENISQQKLQAAESSYRVDQATAQAAEQVLRAAGEVARQRWGAVLARWLTNDTPEFQGLARQEFLLVQLTAPRGTARFSPPPLGTVRAPDGSLVPARLICPAPVTDPRIQAQSFYYMTTNQPSTLLPGMSLAAFLPVGKPAEGVVIPYSAVVWWQGFAWAFFQEDRTHFVRRRISTEQPLEKGWFQASPFPSEQPVLITGAQWLLTTEMGAGAAAGD